MGDWGSNLIFTTLVIGKRLCSTSWPWEQFFSRWISAACCFCICLKHPPLPVPPFHNSLQQLIAQTDRQTDACTHICVRIYTHTPHKGIFHYLAFTLSQLFHQQPHLIVSFKHHLAQPSFLQLHQPLNAADRSNEKLKVQPKMFLFW